MIDTSALGALLEEEETASGLRSALAADDVRLISTVSVLDATCVLGARRGPAAVLELALFFSEFHFEQTPFDDEQLSIAQTHLLHHDSSSTP